MADMTAETLDVHRNAYEQRVALIAARLRGIADEVERRGTPKPELETMKTVCSPAAARVLHAIGWGYANLHLDDLVANAALADRYTFLGDNDG